MLFRIQCLIRVHHGWARRKTVTMKVLSWLENAILKLVLANTVALIMRSFNCCTSTFNSSKMM